MKLGSSLIHNILTRTLYLSAQTPVNTHLQCSLPTCGCRVNPMYWVSEKHQTVFIEVAKAGSSSLKTALLVNSMDDGLLERAAAGGMLLSPSISGDDITGLSA